MEIRKVFKAKTKSIDGFNDKFLHISCFMQSFFLIYKLFQELFFALCTVDRGDALTRRKVRVGYNLTVINDNVETIA